MFEVFIKNLEFECIIGLLEFERLNSQKVIINASFIADEFVDYAKMCEKIEMDFKEKQFYKIEDALSYFLLEFKEKIPTLKCLKMEIIKPEIIKNAKVGVRVEKFY